jgi:hypothetical protein
MMKSDHSITVPMNPDIRPYFYVLGTSAASMALTHTANVPFPCQPFAAHQSPLGVAGVSPAENQQSFQWRFGVKLHTIPNHFVLRVSACGEFIADAVSTVLPIRR